MAGYDSEAAGWAKEPTWDFGKRTACPFSVRTLWWLQLRLHSAEGRGGDPGKRAKGSPGTAETQSAGARVTGATEEGGPVLTRRECRSQKRQKGGAGWQNTECSRGAAF